MAKRVLTAAEERERARLVTRLARQQEQIEKAEAQQAQRRDARVHTILRLKELGMERSEISEATRDGDRLEGLTVVGIDVAVKQYKRRQPDAGTNNGQAGKRAGAGVP